MFRQDLLGYLETERLGVTADPQVCKGRKDGWELTKAFGITGSCCWLCRLARGPATHFVFTVRSRRPRRGLFS